VVTLGEGPLSPPDPSNRNGGVPSGQRRRRCAPSVREPPMCALGQATGRAQMNLSGLTRTVLSMWVGEVRGLACLTTNSRKYAPRGP
jgi:hypothetical protein